MVCQDLPDYTRKVIIEYTGGFIGLEELATRLGFIAPFNLQGNVVMMEDFETEETEWTLTPFGGLSTVTRQTRHKWSGNWAIELFTDDVAGALSQVGREVYYPGDLKYGLFGRFMWDDTAQYVIFGCTIWTGSRQLEIWVRYNVATNTLQIWDSTGGYVTIDPAFLLHDATLIWYPLLLIFDTATEMWVSLQIGDYSFDLTAYALDASDLVASPYIWIVASNTAIAGTGYTSYVDDIVLTKNVP